MERSTPECAVVFLSVTGACSRHDDARSVTRWRWSPRTRQFVRGATVTVDPRAADDTSTRRRFARGDVHGALAQLLARSGDDPGYVDDTRAWLLVALSAAHAAGAGAVRAVLDAEIFQFSPIELLDVEDPGLRRRAAWAINEAGFVLARAGDLDRAEQLLEPLVARVPERTVAHLNLADVYWELGDLTRARREYQTYTTRRHREGRRVPARAVRRARVDASN